MFGFCCQWQRDILFGLINLKKIHFIRNSHKKYDEIQLFSILSFRFVSFGRKWWAAIILPDHYSIRITFTWQRISTFYHYYFIIKIVQWKYVFLFYSHPTLWFPLGKYSLVAVVWNGDPINIDGCCLLMKIDVKGVNIKCMMHDIID